LYRSTTPRRAHAQHSGLMGALPCVHNTHGWRGFSLKGDNWQVFFPLTSRMSTTSLDRRGLAAAVFAYAVWGVFPLYWALLKDVPPAQVIAHRVVWCMALVAVWLWLVEGRGWLSRALSGKRVLPMLAASSLVISINWGLYVWAVTNGHVLDASLGYFINPLANVLAGVLFLREKLTRPQWIAVALAALGVLWLTFMHGKLPWIALVLAGTFCIYGLIRKVAAVEAVPGLALESLILLLPALAWLFWCESQGAGAFGHGGTSRNVLLIVGGALTALPLIGFAFGARRLPYSTIGLIQFIAPTLQMFCALAMGERFSLEQFAGYALIWIGLAVYILDIWNRSRRNA